MEEKFVKNNVASGMVYKMNYKRILYSIGLRVMKYPRALYHHCKANKIKDKNLSLFCNNCFGAQILHDMNIRFNSPCVNLAFDLKDYVEFLSDLKRYLTLDIEEVTEIEASYPVGRFVGTETLVRFMHYDTFEDAYSAWMRRRERIVWPNIRVLLELKSLPTINQPVEFELLQRFINLPYKKAIITSTSSDIFTQYDIIYEVPYFKNNFFWGKALSWASAFSLKRNTDYFDYVEFFNSK